MTTRDNNVNKKLSTGIAGLDAIFHGGLHIHKYEKGHKGIVMLTRGQHGVNKIHLSMQICEGLQESNMKKEDKWRDVLIKTIYAILFSKTNDIVILTVINTHIHGLIGDNNSNEKKTWAERVEEIKNCHDSWYSMKGSSLLMDISKDIADDIFKSDPSKYCSSKEIIKVAKGLDLKIEDLITIDRIKRLFGDNNCGSTIDCTIQQSPLFISINKDGNLLRNSYYDFYIQRLIRDIRMDVDPKRVDRAKLLLYSMPWSDAQTEGNVKTILEGYGFPSITGSMADDSRIDAFKKDIKTGFIYYNGRTHGLHVRHQKGSPEDTGELLLCKLEVPDDYKVRIVGKDTLNDNNDSADGLTTFQKMMKELDKYADSGTEHPKTKAHQKENNSVEKEKTPVEFIMVDGLSRLNEAELAQCPLNALSDKLRSKSIVGIITADEKLLPSEVSTDIVIDMAIRQNEHPEHSNTALKISKCLYQKNAYGWHQYKMRNAGIEVIPSIHLQMGQRFIMDDVVTDAMLPANKYPYPYWLNENSDIYYDEVIDTENVCESNRETRRKDIGEARDAYEKQDEHPLVQLGEIKGYLVKRNYQKVLIEEMIAKAKENKNGQQHHVLFVNLDKDRMEFIDDYLKGASQLETVHLFNFRPSYIHADEMLWALDQQVQAIENRVRKKIEEQKKNNQAKGEKTENNDKNYLMTHYTHVSLVFGDLNYIHYAYPCISKESLFLPALAAYTKRHHMTNYIYTSINNDYYTSDTELFKKEMETIMQMRRICTDFNGEI